MTSQSARGQDRRPRAAATRSSPAAVVAIVAMMIVPLPPPVLDVLIVLNITFSLTILLLTLNVREPMEFSAFPPLLLIATLFRLGLNVSASRLVLLDAARRPGHRRLRQRRRRRQHDRRHRRVPDPGRDPVRGHHQRRRPRVRGVRPVHPRRDARQADGDRRRPQRGPDHPRRRPRAPAREIEREAEFYGSMDGASKFVKGDAIAAIVIIVVNIVGGLAIGIVHARAWTSAQAIQTYTVLTVGDGLVNEISALLVVGGDRHPGHPRRVGRGPGHRPRRPAVRAARSCSW